MDVIRRVLAVLLLSAVVSAQGFPPATASGSLASAASVTLNVSGYASVAFQVTGTWSGTITFEGSIDGTNYQALNVTPTNNSSATTTTTTANGVWTGSVGGLRSARARMSAYTSGTAVVTIQAAASGGGSGFPAVPTVLLNGNKVVTTAGTRVTLAASTTIRAVTIKALSTNTGIIYIGDASVAAASGFQLRAGESVSLSLTNLSTINLDASVSGEGVTYAAVQ